MLGQLIELPAYLDADLPIQGYSMTESLACRSGGKRHDSDLLTFSTAFACHCYNRSSLLRLSVIRCVAGHIAHTSIDSQVSIVTVIATVRYPLSLPLPQSLPQSLSQPLPRLKTRWLSTGSRYFFVRIHCLLRSSHTHSFGSFAHRKSKLEGANSDRQCIHEAH